MSYTTIKKLPQSDDIIQSIPLSDAGLQRVKQDRIEIENILSGKDSRLLIIVGPCSAWPKPAVLDYAKKLFALNAQVKHALKIVMRVYIQKPRTTKGWTGPINQPNPLIDPNIEAGIRYARDMMVQIVEMGLAIADEALFIHHAKSFMDLISWVAIGARSAENQEHKFFASAIDCPVGLKNATHGSPTLAINSIITAQHPHVNALDGYEVKTSGNPYAHLVLRGSNQTLNYSLPHLEEAATQIAAREIKNPAILIDASHDNCIIDGKKKPAKQIDVVFEVLHSIQNQPALKKLIKGFMLESFIKEGSQIIDPNNPDAIDMEGLSITDPCLSWAQTENLLLNLAGVSKQ